jgi:hypothetical protein
VFRFFEAFFVLVLQLDKIFNEIFDFLVFFVVDKFEMVNFSLFYFQIIGDSGVLIFVGLEFFFETLVFDG